MNTQVTATGMQVTAKSNNTFLLIGTENNVATIQAANDLEVAVTVPAGSSAVFPSKPVEQDDHNNVISSATVITADTASNPERWYTAASNDPYHSTSSSGTSTVINAHVLSSGNFDNYVITRTVYLTLAAGSDAAHNLTVTLKNFADGLSVVGSSGTDNSAVKILVVVGNNMVILDGSMEDDPQDLYTNVDNPEITAAATTRVDIYIYYDGSEDAVYTNNIANLLGASFDLEFNVEVVPAA